MLWAAASAGCLVGCEPAWYRQSADREVSQILGDRKERTLGYEPQTEAPATAPTKPAPSAFERIPTSPVPPPTPALMERVAVEVPWGTLGPDPLPPGATTLPSDMGVDPLEAGSGTESLVLGPPAPINSAIRLDLFSSIEYAIQHSRSYQDQMENLYLDALNVTLERHLLGPRPFLRTGIDYTSGQKDVDHRSAYEATVTGGVRQKLPYGGEIVAESLVGFVQAIHGNVTEGESASVALSGSIPLLKGAGMSNLEGLINSERQMIYGIRQFEDYRRSFVVDISSRYFNLVTQLQNVRHRRTNLGNLEGLTERTRALYSAGRISFLEVQRSLQSVYVARTAVINAEQAYQGALDDFKLAMGMDIAQPIEIVPLQLTIAVPQIEPADAVRTAHNYRLNLRTADDQIEDAQRGVSNAENGLLPGLDLTAQGTIGNEPNTPAVQFQNRTATYGAGIVLDLPIDRVAERNNYRSALITLQRAQRNLEQLRDQVANEVRDSLRGMRAAQMSLDIQRRGIELAQRRIEFSNELLKQGKVTARDVVESQSSMLDAQDGYEQAHSQLQIRLLEFMRDSGTLRLDPKSGSLGRVMDRATLMGGHQY
jgi:hypothetical protein